MRTITFIYHMDNGLYNYEHERTCRTKIIHWKSIIKRTNVGRIVNVWER